MDHSIRNQLYNMFQRIIDERGHGLTGGHRVHHRHHSAAGLVGGRRHHSKRSKHTRASGMTGGRKHRTKYSKVHHRASGMTGGKRGASPWITHVKRYAKQHGISYREALSEAKHTYH